MKKKQKSIANPKKARSIRFDGASVELLARINSFTGEENFNRGTHMIFERFTCMCDMLVSGKLTSNQLDALALGLFNIDLGSQFMSKAINLPFICAQNINEIEHSKILAVLEECTMPERIAIMYLVQSKISDMKKKSG